MEGAGLGVAFSSWSPRYSHPGGIFRGKIREIRIPRRLSLTEGVKNSGMGSRAQTLGFFCSPGPAITPYFLSQKERKSA